MSGIFSDDEDGRGGWNSGPSHAAESSPDQRSPFPNGLDKRQVAKVKCWGVMDVAAWLGRSGLRSLAAEDAMGGYTGQDLIRLARLWSEDPEVLARIVYEEDGMKTTARVKLISKLERAVRQLFELRANEESAPVLGRSVFRPVATSISDTSNFSGESSNKVRQTGFASNHVDNSSLFSDDDDDCGPAAAQKQSQQIRRRRPGGAKPETNSVPSSPEEVAMFPREAPAVDSDEESTSDNDSNTNGSPQKFKDVYGPIWSTPLVYSDYCIQSSFCGQCMLARTLSELHGNSCAKPFCGFVLWDMMSFVAMSYAATVMGVPGVLEPFARPGLAGLTAAGVMPTDPTLFLQTAKVAGTAACNPLRAVPACCVRRQVRQKYEIEGSAIGDCFWSIMCLPCVTSQSRREVEHRTMYWTLMNDDDNDGWG